MNRDCAQESKLEVDRPWLSVSGTGSRMWGNRGMDVGFLAWGKAHRGRSYPLRTARGSILDGWM